MSYYKTFWFPFDSKVSQNIPEARDKFRQHFGLEPQSIVVNATLTDKAKLYLNEQEISTELRGSSGCLANEVWLEV